MADTDYKIVGSKMYIYPNTETEQALMNGMIAPVEGYTTYITVQNYYKTVEAQTGYENRLAQYDYYLQCVRVPEWASDAPTPPQPTYKAIIVNDSYGLEYVLQYTSGAELNPSAVEVGKNVVFSTNDPAYTQTFPAGLEVEEYGVLPSGAVGYKFRMPDYDVEITITEAQPSYYDITVVDEYSTTHEIKTPLATIGLACEMLRDETISQDSASRQNFIGIINDENQRMRVLVETILQSAKMSNKNFHISPKEVDVHQIIKKVAQSFTLTLSNRGGSLETQLNADPSVIEADELHLTNLVYNLIDNGIKYSANAPAITVSTAIVDHQLELRVSDHGIGISKEDQKHVFEKFYRVSTGDVHNVKGFGIGLNYVTQVVKLHQGHIALESELGKGSTFIITLPMC